MTTFPDPESNNPNGVMIVWARYAIATQSRDLDFAEELRDGQDRLSC